ncbi:MAG: sulfite exporter TauE/SafE family protein [Microthrixaceae bacterium]
MLTSLLSLVAGFASGILAAVIGVGGGALTTPMIRWMGATPIASVGSTVPAILPGALSGAWRYHREGLIEREIVLMCGLAGVVSAALGAWVADLVDAHWLMVLTAVVIMWCGVSLWRDALRVPPTQFGPESVHPTEEHGRAGIDVSATSGQSVRPRGGRPAMLAIGVTAGFLAGLLGIGGGLVLVPALTLGLRLPVKRAVATSLATVAMMSVTALVVHVSLGHVDWRYALPLAVGIVPGAQVGATFTIRTSDAALRKVAGVLLVVMAALFAGRELAALR